MRIEDDVDMRSSGEILSALRSPLQMIIRPNDIHKRIDEDCYKE